MNGITMKFEDMVDCDIKEEYPSENEVNSYFKNKLKMEYFNNKITKEQFRSICGMYRRKTDLVSVKNFLKKNDLYYIWKDTEIYKNHTRPICTFKYRFTSPNLVKSEIAEINMQ